MADNVPIKDASDETQTIATDEVEGAQYQYVKPAFGADGTATPVSSANPLPVGVGSLPLPSGASTTEKQDAILTAIAALSDAVDAVTSAVQATDPLTDAQLRASAVHVAALLPEPVFGNITAIGGILAIDVSRASNIGIQITAVSGASGVALACEVSTDSTDGTDGTWSSTQTLRSNGGTIATSLSGISSIPAYSWRASVSGFAWFRLRATAGTFGTLGVAIFPAVYGSDPIPAAQDTNVSSTLVSSAPGFYTEGTTALGSGVTLTGTTRDAGSTPSYAVFVANAYADVEGTLYAEKAAASGGPWFLSAPPKAVAAGDGQEIAVRATTRYNRARFVNGASAQASFALTTAYHRM